MFFFTCETISFYYIVLAFYRTPNDLGFTGYVQQELLSYINHAELAPCSKQKQMEDVFVGLLIFVQFGLKWFSDNCDF